MWETEHELQLPAPSTPRWTVRHKAALLEALRRGALTLEEASHRYALSLEELRTWERDFERFGVHGLRATRLQIYRAVKGSPSLKKHGNRKKWKRYSDEQIASALWQVENGIGIEEVCRELGVSESMLLRWKKQFAGTSVGEIRRLKQLEEENAKLKRLMADYLRLKETNATGRAQKTSEAHLRRQLVAHLHLAARDITR